MAVGISSFAGAGAQFFDDNGVPLSGGLIYTYLAGTNTPQATFTSVSGLIQNSNPIVLDSAGRSPNEIWLTQGISYKFVVQTALAVVLGSYDNLIAIVDSSSVIDGLSSTSDNAKGDALIGFKQSNASGFLTNAVGRTVNDKFQESVSVKDFGAVGDGVTNDTDAFNNAAAYINSQGGGKLIVPFGTYLVGKQTFAGATGKGYSYLGSDIISIQNCPNPVVIEFQGAILKLKSGLKFGSFDPVTGAIYIPPSLPFTNADYKASTGFMLRLYGNKNVRVTGAVELDGNNSGYVLGGQWGDTGYQLVSTGVWAYNNDLCFIENVYVHHQGTDGVTTGYDGTSAFNIPAKPLTLINVKSTNNGRQGWSITGGKGVVAIGCAFNDTGKDIPFGSAPGAGVDIESEGGYAENLTFIDCEFSNNIGSAGLIAASGVTSAVTCIRCKFVGTNTFSLQPTKARMSFYDCLIVGTMTNPYSDANTPDDGNKFINCLFTDDVARSPTGVVYNGGYLALFEATGGVLLDNCTFIANRTKVMTFKNGGYMRNCTFICKAGTAYVANQDFVALLWNCTIDNLNILDQITTGIPADAYYISFSNTNFVGQNFAGGSKVRWWNWSPGAGGYSGYLGTNNKERELAPYIALSSGGGNPFVGAFAHVKFYVGAAAPTSGTYARGDRFFNSLPAVGQPKSWVCTVAGTPGTWVSEGNL